MYYNSDMAQHTPDRKDKSISVRVDADLAAAMDNLQARDGISPSEMVRRSLRAWLVTKAVPAPASKRKAVARG